MICHCGDKCVLKTKKTTKNRGKKDIAFGKVKEIEVDKKMILHLEKVVLGLQTWTKWFIKIVYVVCIMNIILITMFMGSLCNVVGVM